MNNRRELWSWTSVCRLAFLGFAAQYGATGKGPLENLKDHLANPSYVSLYLAYLDSPEVSLLHMMSRSRNTPLRISAILKPLSAKKEWKPQFRQEVAVTASVISMRVPDWLLYTNLLRVCHSAEQLHHKRNQPSFPLSSEAYRSVELRMTS